MTTKTKSIEEKCICISSDSADRLMILEKKGWEVVTPEKLKQILSQARREGQEEAELRGVGKILDNLWTNSIELIGEKGAKRIEEEMTYYFGEKWFSTMYEFIGEKGNTHEPVKTLDQLNHKLKVKEET